MKWLLNIFSQIGYSLPVQLLLNHLQRNQVLLLWWFLLFAIISANFGNYLGIPYLFLDPVYLNEVSFFSFFLMGVSFAGLAMVFHITAYILDGPRFPFVGTVDRPFFTFSINNAFIPLIFMITYIVLVIQYQVSNEYVSGWVLFKYLLGVVLGFTLMTVAYYVYIRFTNKNIFRFVVDKVDETIKENIGVTRASAMKKLNEARTRAARFDSYIDHRLRIIQVPHDEGVKYDRATILKVFDHHHFNLISIELFLFIALLVIGIYKDYQLFQIPAAASVVILITLFVMFTGAFSYWFGRWASSAGILLLIVLNILVKNDVLSKTYMAYGLDYSTTPAEYTSEAMESVTTAEAFARDKKAGLNMLNNWRAKFPGNEKPRMVLLCVSGGGQRASLWTYNTLQEFHRKSEGEFFKHTTLITGASGGLIGASYFRELYRQQQNQSIASLADPVYGENLGQDKLNAVIFSFLMNDIFSGWRTFEYAGQTYAMDRVYSFEQQLNQSTNGFLDKPLLDYREPEQNAEIPMLLLAPTIINDGRKLYISPQNVSYMINPFDRDYPEEKSNGVEFLRFFEDQGSENLRFLSALRMNATFPYITPNVTLPSSPGVEIVDAGVTDNFGISDAFRFTFVFRDWIEANTSGVVIVSIRDSEKNPPIEEIGSLSILERLTLPISSIYQSFESMQDVEHDFLLETAKGWANFPIYRSDIQYVPDEPSMENLSLGDSLRLENPDRASLSWRLTQREKESLKENISTVQNQREIQKILNWMND